MNFFSEDIFSDFDHVGFGKTLIDWYNVNGRDLPWRHTKNPYYIWVSEIMLQQTQVETVKPYYERFIMHFPDIKALADATDDDVYKHWEGLGYYRRAKHLKEAAQTICTEYNGVFPKNYDDIIFLKGIGSYTASAIGSIAFNLPKGVIDGNTLRIIARIFNLEDNIAKDSTKKAYQKVMDYWASLNNPSAFNQGMMDLGATVCTPKNPKCSICPVSCFCRASENGTQKLLPVNIKNKNKTDIYYITGILKYDDKYFVTKNEDGLLNGLYGLIQYEAESPSSFEDQFYETYKTSVRLLEYEKEFRHIFSHRVWHMSVYYGEIESDLSDEVKDHLYTREELFKLPIPTAHKKVIEYVI